MYRMNRTLTLKYLPRAVVSMGCIIKYTVNYVRYT